MQNFQPISRIRSLRRSDLDLSPADDDEDDEEDDGCCEIEIATQKANRIEKMRKSFAEPFITLFLSLFPNDLTVYQTLKQTWTRMRTKWVDNTILIRDSDVGLFSFPLFSWVGEISGRRLVLAGMPTVCLCQPGNLTLASQHSIQEGKRPDCQTRPRPYLPILAGSRLLECYMPSLLSVMA